MQVFIPLIYDIFTVGMFIYMISTCSRRGFAKTAASLVGYMTAIFTASSVSKPLATATYTVFIKPPITRSIAQKISELEIDVLPQALLELTESLPQELLAAVGLDKEQLVEVLLSLVGGGGQDAAQAITDSVVQPLVVALLKMVLFLVIFTLAMFFVRRLVWMFSGVNRLPIIGPLNRMLGGVVGIVQAAIMLYVTAVLLTLLVSLTGSGITVKIAGESVTLASAAVFQKTMLFRAFINTNPLDILLMKDAVNFSAMSEAIGASGLSGDIGALMESIL